MYLKVLFIYFEIQNNQTENTFKTFCTTMKTQTTMIPALRIVALAILIPFVLTLLAIWHWKPGSFVLAFVLLIGGAGLTYQLVTKQKMSNKAYMFAVVAALATVLVLFWMSVAVGGILGDDPANMMYFGVLLVGLIGATIAGLEPLGMSRTLLAMAFSMILIPLIALAIGTPAFANGVAAVFGLHAVFATLFVGSALLFRRAASGQKS